ncbi:hypothetical protein F511_13622 [Dorcoceras hygrometricum]|uniref:Uncharacterized protein n=1 Tax=Dorcoceras hygrometricum TaxID=472368 RepID=A0A2Z7AR31_9LAMI|nr:hypothetical protein F511_13622 [Dorcoceras hygrometricum]
MDENHMKERNFRCEDYKTRRVFLRSYPLHWGTDSEASESKEAVEDRRGTYKDSKEDPATRKVIANNGKTPMKKIILAVFQWGEERILIFRRFKHKLTIYVVNCVTAKLKARTTFISGK